jgi:hypothetical protein
MEFLGVLVAVLVGAALGSGLVAALFYQRDRSVWALALVLLAGHALAQEPTPTPAPPCGAAKDADGPCPVSVSVGLGTQVSLGGGADTSMSAPLVAITVDFPVAKVAMSPRFDVTVNVGALPGESLDVEQPTSYRTLGVRLGLRQQLARMLNFSVGCEVGFVNRMPGDTEPRDKTARWWSCFLDFRGEAGHLAVGGGMDSRLSKSYAPTGHVRGRVRLWKAESGRLEGGSLFLGGEAILGADLGWWGYEKRSDVLLVGLTATGGK